MPETIIRKTPDGWTAETRVPIDAGAHVLVIRTEDGADGGIDTIATRVTVLPSGAERHDAARDYRRVVAHVDGRCTRQKLERQHADVLARIETILEDMARFYAR